MEEINKYLNTLNTAVHSYSYQKVRDVFHLLVERFKPDEHIVDWVHKQQAELRDNFQLPEYVSGPAYQLKSLQADNKKVNKPLKISA